MSFSVIRLDKVKERRRRSVELKGLDSWASDTCLVLCS
jgi:hypothetical protein